GFCKNMYQHCLTNAAMPRKSVWRLLLGVFGMVFPVFTIYYFARFYAKGDLRQAYCVDSGADGYSDQIHGSSDLPDCAPGVEAGAPARSKRFPFDFTRQRIALLALLVFNISIARLAWNSAVSQQHWANKNLGFELEALPFIALIVPLQIRQS
ncbi:MAG: hypothetical protein K8963_00135, partial [Proteobacteria bacterium]|nr:hypothetical protein [Pseudomonadota bacterium]